MSHEWKDSMGEISGFGGGYEATCRAMVKAGMEWSDAHPTANPKAKHYPHIYGVIFTDESPAGQELEQVLLKAANGDCTGAMMQATFGHVLAYRRLGWDEYVRQLEEHHAYRQKE